MKRRRTTRDERQAAFDFQGPAIEWPGDPTGAAQDFWKSAGQRYALLGGHMVKLYGTYEGQRCGSCTNYVYSRCEAYSAGTAGWSREWPACGAWCMTDPKDRAALRGLTIRANEADADAVPTPADGDDDEED